MVPVIVNGRIATDAQGAQEFLGITTPTRWERWKSHVPKIEKDWYSYADLTEFMERLREREKTKAKRSKTDRPNDRKTSVVLRSLKGGGEEKGA